MAKFCIAVDAMGGDYGVKVVIPAVADSLIKHPDMNIILVGDENIIRSNEHYKLVPPNRCSILHTEEYVTMDEPPIHALRNKKRSSMRMAIEQLIDNSAQACVSAGNTGALMAISKVILKMAPGIARPAIAQKVPTKDEKGCFALDLGANIDTQSEHLLQFAIMGSILAKTTGHSTNPKVGLVNVGVEDNKGNDTVKHANALLKSCDEINYVGYIEGSDMYNGFVDVAVCDGFAGNIALKASEGLAKMIYSFLKQSFNKNAYNKVIGALAKPIIAEAASKVNPDKHNGAVLLGLRGNVIKSHGGATRLAFANAIEAALSVAKNDLSSKVQQNIVDALGED